MKDILVVVLNTNIGGGITTAVMNFTSELCKHGHNVSFLDFTATEKNKNLHPDVKQIFLKGISKYYLLSPKDISSAPLLKKPLLMLLGLVKKFTNKNGLWQKIIFRKLKEEYDVAVAFRQCAPCYIYVLDKVKAKIKIGFVHGDVNYMGDISSWQYMMKDFDRIAYVSDAVRIGFEEKYPELKNNGCTIYNVLDAQNIIDKANEPADVTFNKDNINIVTVSRINNSQKRINRIPPVISKLMEQGIDNIKWYVIGDGRDTDEVKALAKKLNVSDNIVFLGKKTNPYSLLKNSDIFVLPTKTESYGLVVVEAMILNVPVVVCEYPALKEIFDDGVHGLVAQQSVESLAEKIGTLIKNKELYEKIKENTRLYNHTNDIAYNQFMGAIDNETR